MHFGNGCELMSFERSIIVRFRLASVRQQASKWLLLLALCGATNGLIATTSSADTANSKRVLLLHSFGPLFKPWSNYGRTIRTEIARQAHWPIDFLDFSLVNARSNDTESEAPLVQYLRTLYTPQPLDLIIAIGAPAASFVQRYRAELFATTPMIFTAVDQRRVDYSLLSGNDTVVPVKHDFSIAFRTILQVLPGTKAIAIVNGASPNESFWHGEIQREASSLENRVTLKWYDKLPFAEILKDAAKLPPHTAIFWHLMNVDAAGIVYEANDSLNALASVASAPIFSYDDSFFEGAIVGGAMFSVVESSSITAKVADRILSGEKAGNIKTPAVGFALPRFDWRQMQRWGIAESALPAGSTIYFRSPSFWEVYRWYIVLLCAIFLFQGWLLNVLARERRQRNHAEAETRQRVMELAHVNRYTTAGELTATIAHEVNQPLSAVQFNADSAGIMLDSTSPDLTELKEVLSDIRRDNHRAIEVIRRLRALLKKAPFEAQPIDLNEPVREAIGLLLPTAKRLKIETFSELSPTPLQVNADTIQIQQVVMNLIRNSLDAISEHAASKRRIVVSTTYEGKTAAVSVSDTGGGISIDNLDSVFDPFFSTKKDGMGMGLPIVRTIMAAHHGTASVENGREGAVFRIHLPLIEN